MRGGSIVGLGALALAGCSPDQPKEAQGTRPQGLAHTEKVPDRIACALPGERLRLVCTREIGAGAVGPVWIIRHPNGSFRRFAIIDGGRRIATADGAEELTTKRDEYYLDAFVAGEHYRFMDPNAPES